jgi:hypothetical protein
MEGGGTSDMFVLGDIGDYKDLNDIAPIISSSIIGMNVVVVLSKFGSLGGFSMNAYFDTFGLEGILANTSFLMIIFQMARWAYTTFYTSGDRPWSPFVFICMLIGVQFIHDIFFYYGVIKSIPSGKNDIIDALKKYANENGSRALTGHAVFLIFIGVVAMLLKESSFLFTFIVVNLTLYSLPFMLTTLGPVPPPPPPPPEKKAAPQWNVPRG